MARKLRFVPEGGLVEVTLRTIQGRFLLKPTPIAHGDRSRRHRTGSSSIWDGYSCIPIPLEPFPYASLTGRC